ncbi:organic cation transporter protein-like [Antedon mediterranea]|uniref:organic cation transporter protein-like n=1 Tax=Antedon mediterranea TaxID=105859 RepID=UPI003AF71266
MKFDNVFKYIGEYGLYHKLVTLSICCLIFLNSFTNISTVFISGNMDHHCKPPDEANCSELYLGDCWNTNDSMSLPPDDEGTLLINETQCRMYENDTTELIDCEHGWAYDRSRYDSTIVSEFDLVCEDSYLVSLASSLYLAGFFVGSILFGLLCDFLGRRKGAFLGLALALSFTMLCSLSKSYVMYVSFRFLSGISDIGLYVSVFTYVTELVPPSRRAMVSIIVIIYWCFGIMMLAPIAYFIRSWDKLLMTFSISLSPLLLLYFFIPESPRWLLAKGKTEEAKLVIQKIAKRNKVGDLPDDILDNLEVGCDSSESTKTSPLIILRYTQMRRKTVYITYSWFAVNLAYYGLTYGVEGLNVDVYIGTFLGGVTELFACLFTWFFIQKLGRRCSLAGTLVAGGVACFINIWIPVTLVAFRTSLAMIGKFFITSAFGIVYIYTVELFPTNIRSTGLGICSFFSRVAGMLAPQILFLEKVWAPLPLVAFSFTSVTSGLVALLLPETLNVPLPQTIEEAEMITRKNNISGNKDFESLQMQGAANT